MSTMRGVVFAGRDRVSVESVDVPVPRPGEVLLRVGSAGVCGSDAAEYRRGDIMTKGMTTAAHPITGQALPVIMGHEFAGTVVDVGSSADSAWLDRLVTSGAGVSCGSCHMCVAGRTNLCQRYFTHGYHAHGGLAEYVAVPTSIIVDAGSRGLTSDAAGLGQPMAIAVHAVRRGAVKAGEQVVIVGVGGIGAFIVSVAVAMGAEVLAVDIDEDRLSTARRLGAAHTMHAGNGTTLLDSVRQLGWRPDALFEVTGRSEVLHDALASLSPGSRLVLVGINKVPTELLLADISLRELQVMGTSAHVCAHDLPTALDILAARPGGWPDVAPTIGPLEQVVTHALDPLANGRPLAIKSLFDPHSETERPTAY